MSVEKIISDWKKGIFKSIYWLEGEEDYFIDQALAYAEQNILSETESAFNLIIYYGKDANWAEVINACRRYPMFAERQVVLLKEAQTMKDIEKLEPYIENPSPTTVFIVAYKNKKLDARKKFAKSVKEHGVLLTTKKMYEKDIPEWAQAIAQEKGLTISPKGLALLVDHVGNDLSRIANEINKISVNLGQRKNITEEDIADFIGVSKEYNVFELQSALAAKDLAKAIRIISYFESNPKAAPIQYILPSLYGFFSKVFMVFGVTGSDDKTIATAVGVNPFFVKDYLKAAKLYTYPGVENVLLLLHQYNLKSVGINDAGTEDASLLKEMVVKMLA